jgi:hypothetical protein
VAGYTAYRIFEESVRIDSSEHFLGLRLNFYVATVLTIVGLVWFARVQRGPMPVAGAGTGHPPGPDGGAEPDPAREAGADLAADGQGGSAGGGATAADAADGPDGRAGGDAEDAATAGRRTDK